MYDIAIIGAGPGGYVAAIRASQLGAKVALIEKDHVGGVCLNKGCIPTKAMIASSHLLDSISKANEYGIKLSDEKPLIDMNVVQKRKEDIVLNLRSGVENLLKGNSIELISGEAKFIKDNTLDVSGNKIEAKNILIATGSTWIDLPGIKIDNECVVTSDAVLNWTDQPKRLVIIGGGVIGCEFACMMNSFGVEVQVVEAMPNILPMVEGAISRHLDRFMKARGIGIHTKITVEGVEVDGKVATVKLSSGESIEADKVLVAVGRKPNTAALGIDSIGVEKDAKGFIKTDSQFKTNIKGVYAIGDAVGGLMLAHEASAEGIAAIEGIFGKEKVESIAAIPKPIFTSPEVASVGMTSAELKDANCNFKTGRFPYAACGKALCDGESDGQVIIHADESSGKVLGVHIIGKDATTLIAEAAAVMKLGGSAKDIENTVHSHPTLSETLAEAAADVYGQAIHKVTRKR